jgi:hypothetical protein
VVETARTGRTEAFAEVAFRTAQPVGRIVAAAIAGAAEGRLIAA